MQGGEVHPDLVGAPGFQLDVEQAGGLVRLDRVVVGDAVPTAFGDRELPVVSAVAADRRVDGSAGRVGVALHQSVIALLDVALLERPLEHRVRAFGDRDHHHAGRADVETMHNALPLMDSRRADAKPCGGQTAQYRGPLQPTVACAATPGGLSTATMSSSEYRIDMPSISTGVFSTRRRRFRQPHLQPRAGRELVGLARAGAVEIDTTVFGQRRGSGPRQPEQPRQPGVDAHPRQTFGDRHRASRHSDAVALAAAHRVEVKPEQRQRDEQDRPAHNRRVGNVEHRPPSDGQEIHDMALQRPRRPEEPVHQIAHGAAEDHAETDRPPRRDQPAAHPDDPEDHTGRDQREYPGVAGGHRERGTGVADQRPGHGVADDRHRLSRRQESHREHFGDDVDHQHHRRDGE